MKAKEIFFSIIVPSYNRKGHLGTLISKLNLLQYSNWELIIVDDGSTDNTESLFRENDDEKIKYVKKENGERGAARNAGLKYALGDYVTYLDSDDFLLPDAFIVANRIISLNPNIPIFHLGFEVQNADGVQLAKAEVLPSLINNILVERNVVACLGMFIRKDIAFNWQFSELRELSGTEDYELWLRIAAEMPIQHFNSTVAVLVHHDSRSMLENDTQKLMARINSFISLVLNNPKTLSFLGPKLNKFLAFRYSYIALHAALDHNKSVALNYLLKSVRKYPLILLKLRVWVVLKKMIYK